VAHRLVDARSGHAFGKASGNFRHEVGATLKELHDVARELVLQDVRVWGLVEETDADASDDAPDLLPLEHLCDVRRRAIEDDHNEVTNVRQPSVGEPLSSVEWKG
jgi:hypothetical protein